MLDGVRDLTKLVRRSIVDKQRSCGHETIATLRGIERCASCGDRFPCRSCLHIDCIERRIERGSHEVITKYPVTMVVTNGVRIVFDNTADDPLDWTQP